MNDLQQFIATLGFPIALSTGLAYAMYKVFMVIFQKFIETLDKLTDTNRVLVENISSDVKELNKKVDNKLDCIMGDINCIKNKIEK